MGVNRWQQSDEAEPSIPRERLDALAGRQRERLARWRAGRAPTGHRSLERLAEAARGRGNLVPPIRGACAAGATVGE